MASSSKSQAIPKSRWLEMKPHIRSLYVEKGMKVDDVVTELARVNFRITKPQLEHRLSMWQMQRNLPPEIWRQVGLQITERKQKNKESRVIHCGKTLGSTKVKRLTKRSQERNYATTPNKGSIADAQIVVCTPPIISQETSWPANLPWLVFHDKHFTQFVSNALRIIEQNTSHTEPQNTPVFQLVAINGRKLAPQLDPANLQAQIPRLEGLLAMSMPETYPGENWNHAQNLLRGQKEEILQTCLAVVLYSVSNNLFDPTEDDEWNPRIRMLRDCGILELHLPTVGLDDTTVNGVIHNLFNGAFWRLNRRRQHNEEDDLQILKWTLSSGRDPNIAVASPDILGLRSDYPITPLQSAIFSGSIKLVKLLLHFGADANLNLSSILGTPMYLTFQNCHDPDLRTAVIDVLVEHGASVPLGQVLKLALRSQDMSGAISLLKGRVSDVFNKRSPVAWKLTEDLRQCIGDISKTKFLLDLLTNLYPATDKSDFITPEMFILAAEAGRNEYFRFLYHISPTSIPMEDSGFTALHAAIIGGHRSTCSLIIERYGLAILSFIWPPPIHLATFWCRGSVLELLLENGANVDEVLMACGTNQNRDLIFRCGFHDILRNPSEAFTALDIARRKISLVPPVYSIDHCAAVLIEANGRPMRRGDVVLAAVSVCPQMLTAVLRYGGDPNETSEAGITGLQSILQSFRHIGIGKERIVVAKTLLKNGATVHKGAAVQALLSGDWDLVRLVLNNAGSLLDVNEAGMSSLEAALLSRSRECLENVLKSHQFTYSSGSLCAAIVTEESSTIKQLLDSRAPGSQLDRWEALAISLTAQNRDRTLLRMLFDKLLPFPTTAKLPYLDYMGSWKLDSLHRYYGDWRLSGKTFIFVSPLTVVVTARDEVTFERLVRQGFLADQSTWSTIAQVDSVCMAQTLISNNQRLDNTTTNLNLKLGSPLLCPISRRSKRLFLLLLEAGADVNEHDLNIQFGHSPLQAAIDRGDFEVIEKLLAKGANVNAPAATRGGYTALQIAAKRGYLGIAERLLDLGADIYAPAAEVEGKTALEAAAEGGRLDLLRLLLERGNFTQDDRRCQFLRAVKLAVINGQVIAERMLHSYSS